MANQNPTLVIDDHQRNAIDDFSNVAYSLVELLDASIQGASGFTQRNLQSLRQQVALAGLFADLTDPDVGEGVHASWNLRPQ